MNDGWNDHQQQPDEHSWASPEQSEVPSSTTPEVGDGQPFGGRKRGPRPMVDRATVRVEAQVYPEQHETAMRTLNRLKIENRPVPREDRRRFTINTLIRASLTIALEHADELHGHTEDELLNSLRESLTRGGR